MKVDETKHRIYFVTNWLITEHVRAYFDKDNNELIIVDDKYLPLILKYLRIYFGANTKNTISLTFYESPRLSRINIHNEVNP